MIAIETILQEHLLPEVAGKIVALMDIAERMNGPADLVAIPAMVAAGSVVGCKIGIRPQRQTDWLEVCNLWGCVVAPPGNLKSPSAAEALGPITDETAARCHQAAGRAKTLGEAAG